MTNFEIILISIGLAMDCFAVSTASAIQSSYVTWKKGVRIALMFGLFQGVMPIIGWFAGELFKPQIQDYDHWVAFIILGTIGLKMIFESLKKEKNRSDSQTIFNSWKILLLMSLATSIDALATGFVFIPFDSLIFTAAWVIALTSFIFTILGTFIGRKFGKKFHFKAELLGGFILIGIGVKILIEHLFHFC